MPVMDAFTLTDKRFCTLLKSIHTDQKVTHIKVKGHGNSMTPFLKNKETLFIRPVNMKEPVRVGDIVAYTGEKEEKIIVHRIISEKNDVYKVKGDNSKKSDGWFPKNCIIGVVTQKEKLSGEIVSFKGWENALIAFFSRTGLLNSFILPFGRSFKKKLQRL